jgi:hypothetical protein
VTITFVGAGLGAFISASTDRFSDFELDQLLHHQTHRIASQIDSITRAQRGKKFGQGRLIESHRCVLLQWVLGGTHQESRRWLT